MKSKKTAKKTAKKSKTAKGTAAKNLITKDMTFAEVMQKAPDAAFVMMEYGLHCIGCHVAAYETVEQGAKAHGLNQKQVEKMLEEMNKIAAHKRK